MLQSQLEELKLTSQANKIMDICHASLSPLTYEQEHKFLQAIKTMTRSAYQKCNFEVDHQVLKNLSQEKSYGYLLQGKSNFFFFFF